MPAHPTQPNTAVTQPATGLRVPAELTRSVTQFLRDLGFPPAVLITVESYFSAVWLTPDYVVHYHLIGPVGRLEHAARVASTLAPEALFPEVLAVGHDGAHDWLVTRRVPGIVLSAACPWLTRAERRDAIHQAAAALRAVHAAKRHTIQRHGHGVQ